ncbi:hypothetical protein SK128_005993, partial [Halocaridina rubra]
MVSPRLQRMLLGIQPYNIDIKCRSGKDMIYADYLAHVLPSPGPNVDFEQAIHTAQISTSQLGKLHFASQQDAQLSVLQEQI